MIKINGFFKQELLDDYYNHIINRFEKGTITPKNICVDKTKNDFTVQFLPANSHPLKYTISFKKLLTGEHEEVIKTPGIDLYMDICRFHFCCKNAKTIEKTFIERMYRSFPNEIIKEQTEKTLEYTFEKNNTKCSVTLTSNPTVNGFQNVIEFVTERLKSKDIDLYNNSLNEALKKNNNNNSGRSPNQSNQITFKTLKLLINTLFNKAKKMLLATTIRDGKNCDILYTDYSLLSDSNRHKLIDSLGIKTCPYCNRQFITSWTHNKNGKTTADLDHFYPKSLFPLFALSAFNFIPSCHVCNSLMKGDNYYETIYPYEDSAENEVEFNIKLKASEPKDIIDIWLGKGKDSFIDIKKKCELEIKNTCTNSFRKKLIENEIDLFRFKELYRNHLDEAINVFLILRIYLEKNFYKNNINNICARIGLSGNDGDSKVTKEEIRYFLLGIIADGQGEIDKPLAKLIRDIYNSEVKNIIS